MPRTLLKFFFQSCILAKPFTHQKQKKIFFFHLFDIYIGLVNCHRHLSIFILRSHVYTFKIKNRKIFFILYAFVLSFITCL
jgi:hypothetical protein